MLFVALRFSIFLRFVGLCTPGMGLHRMQRTKCICPQVRLFQGVCWQLMKCMRRGTCSVVSLPQTWTSKTEEEGLFWLSRVWCLSFKICVADFCWTVLGCVLWHAWTNLSEISNLVLPLSADLTPVSFPFPPLVSVTARYECGGYCLSKGMKVAFNVTQGEKASWTEVKCAIW